VKLDKDLVREILLALETDDSDPRAPKLLNISGYSYPQIAYTVRILAEGGLIEALNASSFDGFDWKPQRLTYNGHEYLETIRDAEVWRKTKEIANKAGVFSLQVLIEIGKTVVKQELMKYGVHLP